MKTDAWTACVAPGAAVAGVARTSSRSAEQALAWPYLFAVASFVFFVSLALLWFNAAPTVSYHDSGEFALAAATAGIPHPPGAPSYAMIAAAFVRLGGFADAARGTNLLSGLFAAFSYAMLCMLVQIWASALFPDLRRGESAAAGLGAALVLFGSPAFLEQSLVTEQYTMMTAMIGLMLLLMTLLSLPIAPAGPRRAPLAWCAKKKLSLALGVACGLAISNHPSQIVMGLPMALALFSAARNRRNAPGAPWLPDFLRLSLWAGGGLFLGLLTFLWVPYRSMSDPIMDWGAVKSVDRFIWEITRQQWVKRPISQAPAGFTRAWIQTYRFLPEMGIAGVAGMLAGLAILARKRPAWLGWLLATTIPYAAGMLLGHLRQDGMNITYIKQYGISDWHLPLYFCGAAACGAAFAAATSALKRGGRETLALAAQLALIAWLGLSAGKTLAAGSMRGLDDPERFIHAMLDPLPEDAMVLLNSDDPSHMLAYWRWEREPKSLRWVVYDFPSLPMALSEAAQTTAGWTTALQVDYITRRVVDPDQQPLRVKAPSAQEAASRPLFTEYRSTHPDEYQFVAPWGLLYKVETHRVTNDEARASEQRWRKQFPGLLKEVGGDAPLRMREEWGTLYGERGVYFFKRGMYPEAIEYFDRFLKMFRDNPMIWYYDGFALESTGRAKDAAAAYAAAIAAGPDLPGPRTNLAGLLDGSGHPAEAEQLLTEELRLTPHDPIVLQNLEDVRRHRNGA